MIRNGDQHSQDYDQLRHIMRPGHADYSGKIRYGGFNDYRGGGHFSGRLTAPLVFAGAIASQILASQGVVIGSHILHLADVTDKGFSPLGESTATLQALKGETLPVLDKEQAAKMEERIVAAKNDLDSVGGVIECMVTGLPAGLGDPFFDSVESCISHMMFSVPAVKGIEFGDGFALTGLRGSQANDAFYYDDGVVKTKTNHNGGINGGITNGMPLSSAWPLNRRRPSVRARIPSIRIRRKTANWSSKGATIRASSNGPFPSSKRLRPGPFSTSGCRRKGGVCNGGCRGGEAGYRLFRKARILYG